MPRLNRPRWRLMASVSSAILVAGALMSVTPAASAAQTITT